MFKKLLRWGALVLTLLAPLPVGDLPASATTSQADIACMSSATTGTGAATLGSAISGFLSWAGAGIANGQIVSYSITDGAASETGRGAYTSSGTLQARTTIYKSTNSNAAISLDGSETICISQISQDFVDRAALGTTVGLPQGRLTLVSATPNMQAAGGMVTSHTAQTTIYYDCAAPGGNGVPYFDGTNDNVDTIASCQVSAALEASGTGVENSAGVFDVWWVHSGANRICVATNGSGGGWASDTGGSNTARGTGYSQLDKTTRPYITNKNSITHCYNGTTDYGAVSANQATYLGTFYTTAAGQTGVSPANGTAQTPNFWYIFNAYNRVLTWIGEFDNTGWSYNSTTVRDADGGSNYLEIVDGLGDQMYTGSTTCVGEVNSSATGNTDGFGVGVNSATSQTGLYGDTCNAGVGGSASLTSDFIGYYTIAPLVGFNTFYVTEKAVNTNGACSVYYIDFMMWFWA